MQNIPVMKITIGGDNGSGKSTIARMLASHYGFEHFSTGDFARSLSQRSSAKDITDFMEKERMSLKQGKDIDDIIDEELRRQLEKDNIVIDSRLGYLWGHDAIKLYFLLDHKSAARRIFLGDKRYAERFDSEEQLAEDLLLRKKKDVEAYLKKYSTDYTDFLHYDEVILSGNFENQQEKMFEHVVEKIEHIKKKYDAVNF